MDKRFLRRLILNAAVLIMSLFIFIQAGSKPEREVPFTILEEGVNSALSDREPLLTIIEDQDKLESFYSFLHRNRIPRPEPPELAFESSFVVYVSYGQKNTSGYSIDLLRIDIQRSVLVINSQLKRPLPDSFQAQVITNPYLLLLLPRDVLKNKRVDLRDEKGETLYSKSLQ